MTSGHLVLCQQGRKTWRNNRVGFVSRLRLKKKLENTHEPLTPPLSQAEMVKRPAQPDNSPVSKESLDALFKKKLTTTKEIRTHQNKHWQCCSKADFFFCDKEKQESEGTQRSSWINMSRILCLQSYNWTLKQLNVKAVHKYWHSLQPSGF